MNRPHQSAPGSPGESPFPYQGLVRMMTWLFLEFKIFLKMLSFRFRCKLRRAVAEAVFFLWRQGVLNRAQRADLFADLDDLPAQFLEIAETQLPPAASSIGSPKKRSARSACICR